MRRLLTLIQLSALCLVVKRLLPGARRAAPLTAPKNDVDVSGVSVIIPARNEAARIGPCLTALNAAEVIVVDDQSTDNTSNVARGLGATVIAGQPLPEGWAGKPWALKQGLDAAQHDIVVLLDADTIPQSGLIEAVAHELEEVDVISLAPRFLTSSALEQAVHASMLIGLVYRFGAVGVETPTAVDRIYGNGQCIAFRRSWFLKQGGIELVANEINDDIALLRALACRSARIRFRDGRELIDVRMYDSATDVWRQWPRSLPMNAVATKWSKLFDIAVLHLVLTVPVIRTVAGKSTAIDRACVALRVAMGFAIAPSYEGAKSGVFLSPPADVATVMRLTQVMVRPIREWKGRQRGR